MRTLLYYRNMERSHPRPCNIITIIVLCCILNIIPTWCSQGTNKSAHCVHVERRALLEFKRSLIDPSNRLLPWVGEDCCQWAGIRCDSRTGHVIRLDLRNPIPFKWADYYENGYDPIYAKSTLVGQEVNPSLLDLKHLKHLDLTSNNFSGSRIPNFLGSFLNLRYLNLSDSFFVGIVPQHLGNLSALRSLDLNGKTYFNEFPRLSAVNLDWVSRLSHLKFLDLSAVDLSHPSNSLQAINLLPHLLELHLRHCEIYGNLRSNSFSNLTSIVVLDLHSNYFQGPLLNFVENMTSLQVLDLSFNQFNGTIQNDLSHLCNLKTLDFSQNGLLQGEIHKLFENSSSSPCFKNNKLEKLSLFNNNLSGYAPNWLAEFKNLRYLNLGANSFAGPIPSSLWKLSSLRELCLGQNKFNGSISKSLGQLSHLEILYLRDNSFEGVITDIHFANLSSLTTLALCGSNSFSLKIRSDWIPPFQLDEINLGSCKMGPDFPMWLQTQKSFVTLNISNARIVGSVPELLFNFSFPYSPQVIIDLSSNQFHGKVPTFFSSTEGGKVTFFLEHNKFEGPLPHFPSNTIYINLSNNSVSGHIHENIRVILPNLRSLDLSHNFLNGSIPHSLCLMKSLSFLDLSMNHLFGSLPQCWGSLRDLVVLILSNNSLNGSIPHSLCQMKSLRILDLSMNHLYGSLPQYWSGLQYLQVLDLSSNNISGIIPSSIGKLVELRSLHLNKNGIYGQVPLSLINCTNLEVVDIGENKLSGSIPTWIGKSLLSLKILSLRQNNFNGTIPLQLCGLTNLQLLDLSHNNISGAIPHCFGNFSGMIEDPILYNWNNNSAHIEKIEVIVKLQTFEYSKTISLVTGLHMSSNNLFGEIPEELMTLVALRVLDLSKNKLRGNIPENIYKMTSLEYLYLDENQLCGSIPQSMTLLTSLSHLNLSYNKFSGKIPSGNQFSTFNDPSSFIGNPELCGDPSFFIGNPELYEAPLKSCPVDSSVDIVMPKSDDDGTIEMNWFYMGLASGHVVGFLGFCGMLLFNRTWAAVYFQFLNDVKDWLLVMIEVKIGQLKRKLQRSQVGG